VRAFVTAHPEVLTVLDDIADAIPTFFPAGTTASLAVELDPDERARPEEGVLFVNLRVTAPYREALALLHRFDETWWLRYSPSISGMLVVDIEKGVMFDWRDDRGLAVQLATDARAAAFASTAVGNHEVRLTGGVVS